MNRFATSGPVAITLVEGSDGHAMYDAVLNNQLVARIKYDDWQNPDVDFYSREAAQMLADTIKEVYAANLEADIDSEADMIKHPDGTTTDVPEDKEDDIPSEDEATKVIIIHLNELIQKAKNAHNAGLYELESAFMNEADNFAAQVTSVHKESIQNEAPNLIYKAEELLLQGLDCTAEIEQAEDLMQFIKG